MYRFQVPIQMRMSDLDPFNHVNNGVQCNYFDCGRAHYFEAVFGEKVDWLTMDIVLAHVGLDFKEPILYGENLVCETRIVELGNASIKMIQQLRNADTNRVKTICSSVLVSFDRETGISRPINPLYRERIIAFEEL